MVIREDAETRELYLCFARSPSPLVERPKLIHISPVIDNKKDRVREYFADPGKLTLKSTTGTIEFCFEKPGILRVRGTGASLRLSFDDIEIYENAAPREDGSLEAAFSIIGKLLFVPLAGSMRHDAFWMHAAARTKEFTIDFSPSVETGTFEAAIHEYYSNGVRASSYLPFDKAASLRKSEFSEYLAKSAPKNTQNPLLEASVFALHCLRMPAGGALKAPAAYSSKSELACAVSWQQAIAALALSENEDESCELLMNMFAHQDKLGQLPFAVGCTVDDWLSAGAPMHGFAACSLIKDGFTFSDEEAENLLHALKKQAGWILKARCKEGSLLPMYFHPRESGWMDSTAFIKGLPLESADFSSWLALSCEACSLLAGKLGKKDDGLKYAELSKSIVSSMIDGLWRNDAFICRNAKTGAEFKTGSVLRFLPVMLGSRLPGFIMEALAKELGDEGSYLTPGGVASEKLGSKEFSLSGSGVRGGVNPAVQLILVTGLLDAGFKPLALDIAQRVAKLSQSQGLGDSLPPFSNDPWTGRTLRAQDAYKENELELREDLLRKEKKEPKTAIPWTCSGAAGILGLLRVLAKHGL
ncbi:MAG: hypothetical protein LBU32_25485 [Clostridiales bacterium]|nr:hypothetical protein [Clostridiales bacterium]